MTDIKQTTPEGTTQIVLNIPSELAERFARSSIEMGESQDQVGTAAIKNYLALWAEIEVFKQENPGVRYVVKSPEIQSLSDYRREGYFCEVGVLSRS